MSKVTTKSEVRLSYTNLLTPRAQDEKKPDVLTYSTAVLIPKTDTETIDAIKAAVKEALAEGKTKLWKGTLPKGLKNPLRDGDEDRPDDENYKGMMFVNAKGPRGGAEQPVLLDGTREGSPETTDAKLIYSGVHARVALQFYAFDKSGNRGVACGVSSVLSTGKGEPLANVVTAASARDDFGVTSPASEAAKDFADDSPSATSESPAPEGDDDDPWEK